MSNITLTKRETELVADNLRAFTHNFGDVRIERVSGWGYYVYYPATSENYIQYCDNIHTLDGWLYGVVQGFLRKEFKDGYAFNGSVCG